MTAPSAAQLPLTVRPLPVRPPRSRLWRRLSWPAALALVAVAATGCVTVHGETALIPSVSKAEARKALDHFVSVSNVANSKLDPDSAAGVETGALGAIDGAGLKARHTNNPSGDPKYQPLALSDTRFLIPRQRGWPKWFVTDSAENRDHSRWLLVFIRDDASQPWKASYLLLLSDGQLPDFARDGQGYAEPVPLAGSDLLVQPGELGTRYTDYLQQGGKGGGDFADGTSTSGVVTQRRTVYAPKPNVVTVFADQAADPKHFAPVALRLTNGGALVFFATQHQMKQTVTTGKIELHDTTVRALLTGTPDKSVILFNTAEQLVTVPARNADDGAKVKFLDRIEGTVSAHGE